MKASEEVLHLKVPRNKTALMQHLQLLVMRRHQWWCGGVIHPSKLAAFAAKMAVRYPITRSERGRAYDRSRGRAAVHFVVYPVGQEQVVWWLLSDEGKGGLNDTASVDMVVARNAMSAAGHIFFEDYILHYAYKKDVRKVPDAKTGKEKLIAKNCSTWTWKLTDAAFNETKASIERAAAGLDFGNDEEHGSKPRGLVGILACQRSRPLFSGVRTQVLALHRHADDCWTRVKKKWQGTHSAQMIRSGGQAGVLLPIGTVISQQLPKMTRIMVFGDKPKTVADLAANCNQ